MCNTKTQRYTHTHTQSTVLYRVKGLVNTVFVWFYVDKGYQELSIYAVNVNIWVCLCFMQIATVKSPVAQEMFLKTVLRKSWSPGEQSLTDGKDSK